MSTPVLVEYYDLMDEAGNPSENRLASLVINQPETANALSSKILVAMTQNLHLIAQDQTVRALIIQSKGKHFSAGANLKWMQESARLGYEKNREEAEKLTAMFEAIYHMPMPTIAVAKGASYGGAVGMIAACDYALATESARFCLSEAKIGLIPAVILPYLSRKMMRGPLRRLTLSSYVFNAAEALSYGLVEQVVPMEAMEQAVRSEIQNILAASPQSQLAYKKLQDEMDEHQGRQGSYTADAIAKIRASVSGQEGLTAFFAKRKPLWFCQIADTAELIVDS